jgi:hypothetical protein
VKDEQSFAEKAARLVQEQLEGGAYPADVAGELIALALALLDDQESTLRRAIARGFGREGIGKGKTD